MNNYSFPFFGHIIALVNDHMHAITILTLCKAHAIQTICLRHSHPTIPYKSSTSTL